MKRVFVLFIIPVLLLSLTVTVLAAGGGTAAVTSSGGVAPGQTLSFTVTVSGADKLLAAMVEPTYDTQAFELVEAKFLRTGTITDVAQGNGVIAWTEPTDGNGPLFSFTLKARETVKSGSTYTVGCRYSVRDGNDDLQYCTVVSSTVTVTCSHSFTEKREEEKYLCGEATCDAKAKYYFSCALCGAAGTEVFESGQVLTHDYSGKSTEEKYAVTAANCKEKGTYYYSCIHCGAKGTQTFTTDTVGEHVYDHGCDPDCNTCGQTRTTAHEYQWAGDEKQHWQECVHCKDKQTAQAHTPGPEPTELTAQSCTVCQKVLAPALKHIHQYPDEWASDEASHWHQCSCGSVEGLSGHIWSDPVIVRAATQDADGLKQTKCAECGATQDEILPKTGTTPPAKPVNVWAIVLWSLLGVSVVANGVLVFLYIRKKKSA